MQIVPPDGQTHMINSQIMHLLKRSSHSTPAVVVVINLQRLPLPRLKINNCNKHNIMFAFKLIIVTTLLNLCCGVNQQSLDGHHIHNYNNQQHLLQLQQQLGYRRLPSPTPTTSSSSLQLIKQWKALTYNFLSHAPLNDMSFYNPSNILATGITVTADRIFVATPKLFSGVPSTLNWVSRSDSEDSPVLQAYPDWSFATTGRTDFNCSDLVLVSVYRLRVDSCNRLWVLDAGISRSIEDYEKTCPPKILVFNLKTNQAVRRIDFPPGVLRGESLFTNLVIDETTSKAGTCDDVFVYISDTVEPGIVVYDSTRDTTWRVTHPAMYPDPDFAQGEILKDRFVLMDGIVGLTFDAKKALVYFQPFATDRIFSVTREVLRAGPIAINQVLPVKLVGKKSSQGIGITVAPDGSLIFSPMTETAVASWSPDTNEQNILAQDKEHLQFVADITTTPSDPGYVYLLSSRFQRFFLKNVNLEEVNNRIIRIPIPEYARAAPLNAIVPLSSYPIKSYTVPNNLNSYYQLTNSIQQKSTSIAPALTAGGYFTKPTTTSSHPYTFEHAGIINYAAKNPFTALNQGETFPPRKELRNKDQNSFLETLAAITPDDRPSAPSAHSLNFNLHSNSGSGSYYYHTRAARNAIDPSTNSTN